MRRRDSGKRYTIRFAFAMTAYIVLMLVNLPLTNSLSADSPWRYVTILLPIPAVMAVAWALWRYVVESDELQSRQLLEGFGIAFAGTAICSFAYGMLQIVGAPPLSWIWVTPLLLAWFGVASFITWLRYRS